MGIINLTPDSFSDGGKYSSVDIAVRAALKLVEDGASVIDLGGQSSRPGFVEIGAEAEAARLMPTLLALRPLTDALISVDTYHPEVALKAVLAGADIINTVRPSIELFKIAEEHGKGIVITHNEGDVTEETDIVSRVLNYLRHMASLTTARPLYIDPGIGFGKTMEQNFELVNNLNVLVDTGYPVLLAHSRKSFLPEPKAEWTVRITKQAELAGVAMVRLHEIPRIKI